MPRPWLYPFELHTRSEIVERYGALPEKVKLEEDAPEGYEALLDGVLTRVNIGSSGRPVWDKDESYLLWGTPKRDMGDSFSVWLEDGKVETVRGMFDLTDLNLAFVELVLSLGQSADQVLVCAHSDEVIEPTPEALAESVRRSVSTSWQGDAAERIQRLAVAVRIRSSPLEV
ncbi:hypothetical protein [Deinococcus aquiradiocola]|uniref:Uncharacterized protein n=1 Tax=Deinococcus aquiradiocola TaxID=393059 RepID=A0A917PHR4_9DEIO|nr:hypothetical protein [Deinococcus aquiradiocola]GGJ78613.1 hypothetical protein GCM10008939_23130 [Deinococcus aquiradiocola]